MLYFEQQGSCYDAGNMYYWYVYDFANYYDPNGTTHTINQNVSSWSNSIPCGSGAPPQQYTGLINDGSGYTITVTANPSANVYPPSAET